MYYLACDLAKEPRYGRLITTQFRLAGEKANRFYHLHQSTEGPLEKQERVHSPGSGVCGENGQTDGSRPCFLLSIIPDPGYY